MSHRVTKNRDSIRVTEGSHAASSFGYINQLKRTLQCAYN